MKIDRPLKTGLKIKDEDGKAIWMHFKYERLAMFSYVRGCLGHGKKECEILMNHRKLTIEGH